MEVAVSWGCELGEPFSLSRHSFVAPAGPDAVLKLTLEDDDESAEEGDALALWNGAGAVHVRRRDPARRALLLERARPGTDISRLPEREATAIAVEVAWQLWRWADAPFRWIGDHVPRWLAAPERETALVPLARGVYSSLDVGRSTLVHGDFHHHNILSSARGPLAIDPKPMLGEPEFDVAPFLWNPIGSRLDREVAEGRLDAFADAGLDQRRMRAWAVVRGGYLGVAGKEAEVLRDLLAG